MSDRSEVGIRQVPLRSIYLLLVPISIYTTGGAAVLQRSWGESCAAPCGKVIPAATVEPINETWVLIGSYGGQVAQALFILVVFIWVLFFIRPVIWRVSP